MNRMTKRLARPEDAEAGAFIGFDSSSDSEVSQDEVSTHVYPLVCKKFELLATKLLGSRLVCFFLLIKCERHCLN